MQQNLIDAARAVIAADRAGELTDEHILALEAAANAEAAPAGAMPVANSPERPDGWALVKSPITEEMHCAAVKVLVRANGVDGLPQRMLDAMVATAPPATVKDSLIVQPAPAEPACHIAEVSDEEVAIACTPAQRLLLREGMQLYAGPVAMPDTQAALDVLAERKRQVESEGWTPEKDDQYSSHVLSVAAGCYAMYTLAYPAGDPPQGWPFDPWWWKPSDDTRRNYVKAAALLLAEIERIDRAGARLAAEAKGGEA